MKALLRTLRDTLALLLFIPAIVFTFVIVPWSAM